MSVRAARNARLSPVLSREIANKTCVTESVGGAVLPLFPPRPAPVPAPSPSTTRSKLMLRMCFRNSSTWWAHPCRPSRVRVAASFASFEDDVVSVPGAVFVSRLPFSLPSLPPPPPPPAPMTMPVSVPVPPPLPLPLLLLLLLLLPLAPTPTPALPPPRPEAAPALTSSCTAPLKNGVNMSLHTSTDRGVRRDSSDSDFRSGIQNRVPMNRSLKSTPNSPK